MGARLSQLRGPAGTTEVSVPSKATPPATPKPLFNRRVNGRTITTPLAAFTMAVLLFVYTRTSIRAAKSNAKRHREADSGGEGLSLLNEDRRRHGMKEKIDGGGTINALASEARAQILGGKRKEVRSASSDAASGRSEEDERLRTLRGKMRRKGGSADG